MGIFFPPHQLMNSVFMRRHYDFTSTTNFKPLLDFLQFLHQSSGVCGPIWETAHFHLYVYSLTDLLTHLCLGTPECKAAACKSKSGWVELQRRGRPALLPLTLGLIARLRRWNVTAAFIPGGLFPQPIKAPPPQSPPPTTLDMIRYNAHKNGAAALTYTSPPT